MTFGRVNRERKKFAGGETRPLVGWHVTGIFPIRLPVGRKPPSLSHTSTCVSPLAISAPMPTYIHTIRSLDVHTCHETRTGIKARCCTGSRPGWKRQTKPNEDRHPIMETFDSSAPAGDYRLYPLQAIPFERTCRGKIATRCAICVCVCVCVYRFSMGTLLTLDFTGTSALCDRRFKLGYKQQRVGLIADWEFSSENQRARKFWKINSQ